MFYTRGCPELLTLGATPILHQSQRAGLGAERGAKEPRVKVTTHPLLCRATLAFSTGSMPRGKWRGCSPRFWQPGVPQSRLGKKWAGLQWGSLRELQVPYWRAACSLQAMVWPPRIYTNSTEINCSGLSSSFAKLIQANPNLKTQLHWREIKESKCLKSHASNILQVLSSSGIGIKTTMYLWWIFDLRV